MSTRRRWMAGIAATFLAVAMAGTAFGYAGEVASSVSVARPSGILKCGVKVTVRATVRDAKGKAIAGQPVTWSFTSTPTKADKILHKTSITSSAGVATTTVVLACVPGSRRLRARADNVYGSAVLNVTAAGLPNTSTAPGDTPAAPGLPIFGTLLAALALAAGGGIVLRRFAVARR